MERPVFSVSELNNYVRASLEENPLLQNVCVMGEISNYKLYPSGHHYFSLKDADSSVSCVLFKGQAFSLRFRPENGLTVLASGRVSVYPRDGKYQLIVNAMMPAGSGDLQLAFEQLKARLDREGLFDPEHKKSLPVFPEKIAVITSPVGAAVQDVIRILGKRWPSAEVLVVPVRVQGAEAPGEICRAIRYVNRFQLADVIITGRGGGSAEDLWAFNDELVARSIYDSDIPVISAVGHEPDVTISDYVADRRASTPSNAAEICVPDSDEVRSLLSGFYKRLSAVIEKKIIEERKNLLKLESSRVLRDPAETFSIRRVDIDMLRTSLCTSADRILEKYFAQLSSLSASLDALSPLKVLSRGYSFAVDPDGRGIRSVSELPPGKKFRLKVSDGTVNCISEELENNRNG